MEPVLADLSLDHMGLEGVIVLLILVVIVIIIINWALSITRR